MAKYKSRAKRCSEACDTLRGIAEGWRAVAGEIREAIGDEERQDTFALALKEPELIEDAVSVLEELKDELQSWFDNLPEGFQQGDLGSRLEEAVGNLDSAQSTLDAVSVPDLPADDHAQDAAAWEEIAEQAETAADEIDGGADEAEGTEFPGMYGR